jgi:hypothetical protein
MGFELQTLGRPAGRQLLFRFTLNVGSRTHVTCLVACTQYCIPWILSVDGLSQRTAEVSNMNPMGLSRSLISSQVH